MFICCGLLLNRQNYKSHYKKEHEKLSKLIPCPKANCDFRTYRTHDLEIHFNLKHRSDAFGFTLPPIQQQQQTASANFTNVLGVALRNGLPPIYEPFPIPTATNQVIDEVRDQPDTRNVNDNLIMSRESFYGEIDDSECFFDIEVGSESQNSSEQSNLQLNEQLSNMNTTESHRPNTNLNLIQTSLIKTMNTVKSKASITTAALKESFTQFNDFAHSNFKEMQYTDHVHQQLQSAINSSYYQNQLRNNQVSFKEVPHHTGPVYYADVEDLCLKYLENDQFWSEIIAERER